MTDLTITPEEAAQLREMCAHYYHVPKDLVLKLFASLEQAEIQRDYATTTVGNIQGKVAMYDGKRRVAERKCEVLAEALAWGAGKKPWWQYLPWFDAKAKWLDYAENKARQHAAKENDNVHQP